jgi:hypothetical protein
LNATHATLKAPTVWVTLLEYGQFERTGSGFIALKNVVVQRIFHSLSADISALEVI